MKITTLALTAMILCWRGNAQTIDTAVLKMYEAGTVAKVVQWAGVVRLTPAQQMRIAAWYNKADSSLKADLVAGNLVPRLESREEDNRLYVFKNLLNATQQQTCERYFGQRFGRIAARGELAYIREEYHPDSLNEADITRLLTDKYSYLYQRYLYAGSDEQLAEKNVKEMNKYFDAYGLYPELYGNKFVGDYLASLRRIRPVADTTEKKIRHMFDNVSKARKYSDWGSMLDDIARLYIPDTSIYSALHHAQFLSEAITRCAVDRYNLIHLHHVSAGAYDSVSHLIVDKNYENSVIQYTYGGPYPKVCDSLIGITTRYYDSAVEASLIRDGALQPSSQFAIGLKYKEFLRLRPEIIDSLVEQAMYLSHWRDSVAGKNAFAPVYTDAYESEVLTNLLTEEEYTNLLIIKNQPQALADAKKDWAEMEQRGMAKELLEQPTVEQLTSFYILRYSAWNRFAHDKDAQMANIRALDDSRPQCLKALDNARWNPTPAKSANAQKIQW